MQTERKNPNSLNLDEMETLEILQTINDEDKQVAIAVEKVLPAICQAVDAIVEQLRQGGRLIYIGSGTSGRLGLLDAVECIPTFNSNRVIGLIAGGEKAFLQAVEGAEDKQDAAKADLKAISLTPQDIVVGIAASGRTPYTVAALAYANSLKIRTVGIACNIPSPLLEQADIAIGIDVGAEVLTGSTRMKSGTAQKMVLNMLSTTAMVKLGKVYTNLMVDVQATNQKLRLRAQGIVMEISGVDEDKAATLLELADYEVKTAIIMALQDIDVATARASLAQTGGNLRKAIS